jgi:hypothetical protein
MQNASVAQKDPTKLLDITKRVSLLGRDETILWPLPELASNLKRPAASGIVRLAGGAYYQANLWPRGRTGFGIKFIPWDRVTRKPIPGAEAIFTVLRYSAGDGCYRGESPRALIAMWPRIAKNRQVFELKLTPKPGKETVK